MAKRKRKKDRRVKSEIRSKEAKEKVEESNNTNGIEDGNEQGNDVKSKKLTVTAPKQRVSSSPSTAGAGLLDGAEPERGNEKLLEHNSNSVAIGDLGSSKKRKVDEESLEDDGLGKKKRRKKRKKGSDQESQNSEIDESGPSVCKRADEENEKATAPSFPFETDPDDHCESPLEAYRDIVPLLEFLSKGKSTAALRIYDPYYCNGSVVSHFSELGFPSVYNKKEDCYSIWSDEKRYPEYDVFVSNPPYSGDHMERLFEHLTSRNSLFNHQRSQRPWMLLLPNWVHKKDFFKRAVQQLSSSSSSSSDSSQPFFLVPRQRYVYQPPKDFRIAKRSDVHKKSSPWMSMWYIWGGNAKQNEALIRHYLSHCDNQKANGSLPAQPPPPPRCDLARTKNALRDLRRKKR